MKIYLKELSNCSYDIAIIYHLMMAAGQGAGRERQPPYRILVTGGLGRRQRTSATRTSVTDFHCR